MRGKFSQGRPRPPALAEIFVTRMLTSYLFAVANLLVQNVDPQGLA